MIGAVRPKILVTRPLPGADQTAARLAAAEIEPVILPLTEMVKLQHQADRSTLRSADAIIVTSANAVRFADFEMLDGIKNLSVFTVGDATRDAAFGRGMENVVSADGDAQDLIELAARQLKPNSSIVYLCGRTRTEEIETSLAKMGIKTRVVETYQTKKVSQLTYKLRSVLDRSSLDGVLLYSAISAGIFSETWQACESEKLSAIPMCFCISERAKAALSEELQPRAIVCSQPRDDVMIDTVSSYFRHDF